MNQETFKNNMDGWIKDINKRLTIIETNNKILIKILNEIEYNYHLIQDLEDKSENLYQEINAMKLIQMLLIRNGLKTWKKDIIIKNQR